MREAVIHKDLNGEAVGRGMALRVDGLAYRSHERVLMSGVSLELSAQGITVIMGPNGAGKSLFLRLIHGLLTPARGRVFWNEAVLSKSIMLRQALVFQKPVLLRRTVAANIEFVLKARGIRSASRSGELLDRVGLGHLAKMPARRLSGGECQRLQFARAIATRPDVLLMDEPTANLDPASTAVIEELVRDEARRGAKVIYVTHDIGQAQRIADDVVFLAGGRVAEVAKAAAFFAGPESQQAKAYLAGHLVLE